MTETLNENGLLEYAPDSIFTYTGNVIRPLDPDPNDIYIEDIAHALSMQCRWTGHTSRFYSVAEHSVLVARAVEDHSLKLAALLHDASEAYLADLARPIKKAPGLGEVYLEVEARLESAIATRFGTLVDPLSVAEIKQADEWVLWAEAKELLPPRLARIMPRPPHHVNKPVGWSPRHARYNFMEDFCAYGGGH